MKDIVNLTKKRLIIYLVIAFFGGVALAPKQPVKVETKTEVKEIVKNEEEWKSLKRVDDTIIDLAAEGLQVCAANVKAFTEFDVKAIQSNNEKMNSLTPKVQSSVEQRGEILTKLGY